jgi:hypothetical protein
MKILGRILILQLFLIGMSGFVFGQNYKIKQVTTINGQKMESTVYVKGSRKRTESGGMMGMGGGVADIEQCDMKRNVKVSDKKRMYSIEPFDDGSDTTTPTPTRTQNPKSKIEKGGTVTYISNIVDTGERKQMFGLTARHIKTSMSMQASPDACMKENMTVETDGWYIDLPEFVCPMTSRPSMPTMPAERNPGGCRDRITFKTTGGGKLGFALSLTTTMNNGDMSFSQTTETLEFSKATLDAALFDIPAGYTETQNSSDLYGRPDFSAMMKNQNNDDDDEDKPVAVKNKPNSMNMPMPATKRAGTIRIGVYAPTNNAGENISTTNMQMFLIQKLSVGNVEAVSVASEADARAAGCDYVLSSDFSKLKQSTASKIGGIFGKVTNTDTSSSRNYDAQVDFKLVPLAGGGKALNSKAANKSESDVDRAAEAVLALEAQQILGAVQK